VWRTCEVLFFLDEKREKREGGEIFSSPLGMEKGGDTGKGRKTVFLVGKGEEGEKHLLLRHEKEESRELYGVGPSLPYCNIMTRGGGKKGVVISLMLSPERKEGEGYCTLIAFFQLLHEGEKGRREKERGLNLLVLQPKGGKKNPAPATYDHFYLLPT